MVIYFGFLLANRAPLCARRKPKQLNRVCIPCAENNSHIAFTRRFYHKITGGDNHREWSQTELHIGPGPRFQERFSTRRGYSPPLLP